VFSCLLATTHGGLHAIHRLARRRVARVPRGVATHRVAMLDCSRERVGRSTRSGPTTSASRSAPAWIPSHPTCEGRQTQLISSVSVDPGSGSVAPTGPPVRSNTFPMAVPKTGPKLASRPAEGFPMLPYHLSVRTPAEWHEHNRRRRRASRGHPRPAWLCVDSFVDVGAT
jgi:hypothetical protein